jgi:hypothetical protein
MVVAIQRASFAYQQRRGRWADGAKDGSCQTSRLAAGRVRIQRDTRGYCAGPSACAVDAPWMGQGQGPPTEWARRATWLHVQEASGDGGLHGVCNCQKPGHGSASMAAVPRLTEREREAGV